MAKPIHLPTFDTNLTNSVEPVSGRKTDGWATNDIPTSANFNWLFAYIYLWIKWVDDGIWSCVSLEITTGDLTLNAGKIVADNNLSDHVLGPTQIDGNLTVNFDASVGGDLAVGDDLAVTGDLTVTGTANSIPLEALQTPTFQNSWVNAFSGGGGEDDGKYWKNPFGEVELKGVIAGGSTTSIAFTLPSGYRPPFQMRFPVLTATGATESEKVGAVTVNTNGTVAISYPSGTGTVYLNGIRFRV